MAKRIFDTNVLIAHWQRCKKRLSGDPTSAEAEDWARVLIKTHGTRAIVTPVYVEFIVGTLSSEQLKQSRAFLGQFDCVDSMAILPTDWKEAIRIASRVPRMPAPRQLGDCLISAIARRLKYEVLTSDMDFPHA